MCYSFFKVFFTWASQQLVLKMQVVFCGVRKKVCTMLLNQVAPIFKFYKLCWVKDKGTLGPHETTIWGGYNFYGVRCWTQVRQKICMKIQIHKKKLNCLDCSNNSNKRSCLNCNKNPKEKNYSNFSNNIIRISQMH